MGDVGLNRLRETLEIATATLTVRDDLLVLQVGGDGNEGMMVLFKILLGHVGVCLSASDENLEIVEGKLEMGVEPADLVAECGEGGIGLSECLNELPRFAFHACVTTCPLNLIAV